MARDAVVVIDQGGDLNLMHTCRSEALAQNREFHLFCLYGDADFSTFDPFQSISKNSRSCIVLVELLINGLNLEAGSGYGNAYFTLMSLGELLKCAKYLESKGEDTSLAAVVDYMERDSHRDAGHIRQLMNVLLEFDQLQDIEGVRKIDLDLAIEEGHCIYYFLPTLDGSTTARQIGGLALYATVVAAMERVNRGKEKKHVWIIVDEFQNIVGRAFSALVAQCLKYGCNLLLANQSSEQLKEKDVDVKSIVADNCSLKIYLTCTLQEDFDDLQLLSMDEYGLINAESFRQESHFDSQTSREYIRAKLLKNLILAVSANEGYAFVLLDDGKGFKEPAVVYLPYGLTEEVHSEIKTLPKRDPSIPLLVRPTVGVTKPFVPSWKKNYTDQPNWIERQKKLNAMWLAEGGQ